MPLNRFIHTLLRSIATSLLLLAFLFQVYNKAVYTHTHILANGNIITHAHPYTKTDYPDPVTNHRHTKNEILLLSKAELLFLFFATAIFYPIRNSHTPFTERPGSLFLQLGYDRLKNKSPPFFE